MIVTINTDAAYHSKEQVGGFAFWIVCDEGKICHSGVLRKKVSRAELAEFKCILNAIYVLGKMNYKNVGKVIVNTDCLNVIHLIKNDKKAIKAYGLSWGKHFVREYEALLQKIKIPKTRFEFRHVKAHESTETKRQFVNDWCDKAAKEQMWKKVNSNKAVVKNWNDLKNQFGYERAKNLAVSVSNGITSSPPPAHLEFPCSDNSDAIALFNLIEIGNKIIYEYTGTAN